MFVELHRASPRPNHLHWSKNEQRKPPTNECTRALYHRFPVRGPASGQSTTSTAGICVDVAACVRALPSVGSSKTVAVTNWPTCNTLVLLDPTNRNHALRLCLASLFHPVGVLDEGLMPFTRTGPTPCRVTCQGQSPHSGIDDALLSLVTISEGNRVRPLLRQRPHWRGWPINGKAGRPSTWPVQPEFGFDISYFRTRGEIVFGENQSCLETVGWRNIPAARLEALCWEQPNNRAAFLHLSRQYRSNVLQTLIRFEGRLRSRFGYFIPYQNVEKEWIAPPHRPFG